MTAFRIEATRGDIVESVHLVSAAVTDPSGRLIASAGDPDLLTYWRSAAKPFQALPLVEDGGADAFGLDSEELALTCASHSSEPRHLQVASRLLQKTGSREADLACGPHTPLGSAVAARVAREGIETTPLWSNCSGKHAGMLAQARHHGWPTSGYERAGHPVQERIRHEILRWTGAADDQLEIAIDGCTAACFGLPLRAMATAYARLATSDEPAAARIRNAMMDHPELVAGTGRFCTDLMQAWPHGVLAKVGAEGVYSAALIDAGWGIALKIEDGDGGAAPVALYGILRQLLEARGTPAGAGSPLDRVAEYAQPTTTNTRGEATGVLRASGRLQFAAPSGADSMPPDPANGVT